MTHKQLIQRISIWAKNTKKLPLVVSELCTSNYEHPDVIAFNRKGVSILVECKVSRSDFLADKKKIFRKNPDMGMGNFRYYACPLGVIRPEEVPEHWGLLYVEKNVKIKKEVERFEPNKYTEISLLVSAMKRLEISTAVFVRQEE